MRPTLALYRTFLARYLGPYRWHVLLLALAVLTSTVGAVWGPRILRDFIDGVVAQDSQSILLQAVALYVIVNVVRHLADALMQYLGESVAWAATNQLRGDLLQHCIRLDMTFFNRHPPGEMLERIDGDSNQLAHFFSVFGIRLASASLILLGILGVVASEDWRVFAGMLCFLALSIWVMLAMRHFGVPYNERLREATAQLFGFVEERLASLEDIKSLGGVPYTIRQMLDLIREQMSRGQRAFSLGNLMWPLNLAIMGTGTGLLVGGGGWLVLRGEMSIGTVYLLMAYLNLLFWPLENLSHQMEELQKAGGSLVRIQELLDTRSALTDGFLTHAGPTPPRVRFDNVSFRYASNEEPVLEEVSFNIEPGRTLGILGRTGSGKTTVTRLLNRLYDPGAGNIFLNDTDLRSLRMQTLRSLVGVVTQEVQFFRGTLRQNLTMFDPQVPDERILAAIDRLNLTGWLAGLPAGLDTGLSSSSLALSAGEAQRLALVRLFLRGPSIVILDEAAARLDPATELEVESALQELLDGCTGIVIAHRLKSVEKADDILILENGCVREYGDRLALMADPDSELNELLRLGLE